MRQAVLIGNVWALILFTTEINFGASVSLVPLTQKLIDDYSSQFP